jgi:hypothetical protein
MLCMTFQQYIAMREGLLSPTHPPLKGLPRINATPFTNPHRKRLRTNPVKKPNPFAPTIRKVAQVVPDSQVAKLGFLVKLDRSSPYVEHFPSPLGCCN